MGLKLQSSSGGSVELVVPVTASAFTATVPAANTALVGTDTTQTLSNKTLTSPTMDTASITGNLQFNSGYGSVATAYGCRAWVNFNGTGTVAIRASGNVSSITDNGTGDYTVNFTNVMPDANYAFIATGAGIIWGGSYNAPSTVGNNNADFSTSSARLRASMTGNLYVDQGYLNVAIFR